MSRLCWLNWNESSEFSGSSWLSLLLNPNLITSHEGGNEFLKQRSHNSRTKRRIQNIQNLTSNNWIYLRWVGSCTHSARCPFNQLKPVDVNGTVAAQASTSIFGQTVCTYTICAIPIPAVLRAVPMVFGNGFRITWSLLEVLHKCLDTCLGCLSSTFLILAMR